MKIGIIGFGSLRMMQYLYKYTSIFDKYNIEYEVYSWDRLGNDVSPSFKGNSIVFKKSVRRTSFLGKIGYFLEYKSFLKKNIIEKEYDKLIVLTTQSAFSLAKLLLKKYKSKYIYDYRDVTKEGLIPFYKTLVKKLFNESFLVMISSKGFLSTIGRVNNSKIVVSHNTGRMGIEKRSNDLYRDDHFFTNKRIRISYWGIIRQFRFNKKVCGLFGKDNRFELVFHGNGCGEKLKRYCEKKGYKNIFFTGLFGPNDIDSFSSQADIINCLYLNDRIMKNTLQVKIYDAIRYHKPIMVSSGSYSASYLDSWSGAFCFDYRKKSILNELFNWYTSLDSRKVNQQCLLYKEKINKDELVFESELLKFVGYEKKE